ncbi:MAG: hypothetical protein A3I77_01385 [Gammaproteobacteria bacterium RIFCSPLOWO2_02_FULL_42_14]|nr:MAG: hypothetical protein A3B71_07570 [Gammaproteobacteria bacterium RIFCSPHIGHO2_02_FULL_42_43]OGT29220.1 MAG: hypothetical protein A2624_07145 [Gammaproteobacteria bacterium RIFCSPHIGHO2_01_FULL_42_8]OGT52416.1 MAG: hypothetical protein A3E54_01445 [Gammaproteobacteria bacterium RIFCSPHIGHO2_12_FULL_41_25]OGT61966.1 MAG: hypothetical protein A3I77_01385 [Gammaproteobacteria bacterium RIFCSPLOWO2_02_FULL_42_14]OGT86452.1 MAG: hypothetical protein A3G86_07710 [Gammaproteobacteria bacterium R
MPKNNFLSDNCSPVDKKIFDCLIKANTGKVYSYGDDDWTENAIDLMKQHFGKKADIYFLSNGTAANALAMKSTLKRHQAIICSDVAHLHENESGAIEAVSGNKILPIKSKLGKINVGNIAMALNKLGCIYTAQPKLISISQATELGTVYSINELKEIKAFAKEHNLLLHIDGARLANAAVFLKTDLKEICDSADIFSFGCTKNGGIFGDALIFSNNNLSEDFFFLQKQNLQLTPKTRYISAQYIAMFENDLWKTNAQNANMTAIELSKKLSQIEEVSILYPIEINMIFVKLPPCLIVPLLETNDFSIIDKQEGIIRLVTSFDTTETDINNFILSLKKNLTCYRINNTNCI